MERAAASGYGADLERYRCADRRFGCAAGSTESRLPSSSRPAASARIGIRGTAELLDNRFSSLRHGRRTALPRHETLNAMLDWSYSLLSEREKLVLCRLAVFVGHFTLQAAGSVASDDGDKRSGRYRRGGEPGCKIPDIRRPSSTNRPTTGCSTLRAPTPRLNLRSVTKRIASPGAMRSFIPNSSKTTRSSNVSGEHDLSGYAPHIGNVRAALGWALSDRGDAAVGIDLAAWAAPLFIGLSLLEECRDWCERALAAPDDASRGTRQEMILQEALALSSMYTSGQSDQVRSRNRTGTFACGDLSRTVHANFAFSPVCNSFSFGLGDIRKRLGGRGTGRRHCAGCQAPGRHRLGGVLGGQRSPLSGQPGRGTTPS